MSWMSENRKVALEYWTKTIRRHAIDHGDNNRRPIFELQERRFLVRWGCVSRKLGGWPPVSYRDLDVCSSLDPAVCHPAPV